MSMLKRMMLMLFLGAGALIGFAADTPSTTQPVHSAVISGGEWAVNKEDVEQKNADTPALLVFGDKTWKDYTIELEGQKTGGDEGFLIAVRVKDAQNLVWFNVGGWGNTRTAFEFADGDNGKSDFGDQQTYGDFQEVVTNKWHKLKVVVSGNKVEGFLDGKSACKFDAPSRPQGCVAVGTWSTQAKFRNIKVTSGDGKVLWDGLPSMIVTTSGGEWTATKDEVAQNNSDTPALLMFGDKSWKDYTIDLEGQKTGGDEGFLIAVRVQNAQNLVWFNVGGWGNTRTAFEFADGDNGKTDFGDQQTYGEFQEVVESKWHKLKVVVSGNKIEGFLDGKSACKFDAPSLPQGGVAVGTWSTQAKFRNIKVTSPDGKVLWEGIPKVGE